MALKRIKLIYLIAVVLACGVSVLGVLVAAVLFTSQGAAFVVDHVSGRILGRGNVVYERIEGSLIRGVRVFQTEVRRPLFLGDEYAVRVQEIDMRLVRFSIDGIETKVMNARLIDPKADPLVVNGALTGDAFQANLYAHSLDLNTLSRVVRRSMEFPLLNGELADLDLFLSGGFKRPVLKGRFKVGQISQNGFILRDAPVECDLLFSKDRGAWAPYGKVYVEKGVVEGLRSKIRLGKSRLLFAGDAADPDLDIHASALVGRVRIDVLVKGPRREPKVHLVSDPALPQGQLLLMLATGKRWDGLSTGVADIKMSPQLAGDLVDYLFFGGQGAEVFRSLGISEMSVQADTSVQAVKFSKGLSDDLDVGYGVKVKAATETRPREVSQTLETEYRIGSKVTVGAQKELLPRSAVRRDELFRDIPDDRVFLKYRTQF